MSITKINTPELLDFPNDSISSANTAGTVIPTGYTNACNFPTSSSGIALYQFENNVNDTCNNYNLTAVGSPAYVSGKFGQAIQFNGTSQGATSASAIISKPAATISLWFNGNGTATTEFYIIGVGVGGSSYGLDIHYYDDGIVGGRFYGGVVDAGSFQGVGTGATTVNTSTWYHLALTWDGTTNTDSMKLYLNGALETNITPTVTAASLTYSSFGIGKTATSTYAPGIVDQVRIFDTVLTPTQITELYNETTTEVYRPTTSLNTGEFRYNQQLGYVEYYTGTNWQQIADEYITGQPTTCLCNYPWLLNFGSSGVALYEFEDNTDDTCNNYNGTPIATAPLLTYATGKYGKAAVFNKVSTSSGSYVTVPGNLPFARDFSISIWFNPATLNAGSYESGLLLMQRGYTSTIGGTGIGFYLYGTELRPWIGINGANWYQIFSAGTLAIDTWYHTVLTRTYNSQWELFLNGTSLGTYNTQGTTADFSADHTFYFGGNVVDGSYFFDGKIDQVRMFTSALNSVEVTELYNEIACN